METLQAQQPVSGAALWAGRIINGLVILFLLFDAIAKIFKEQHSMEGSVKLGWPVDSVQCLGILLLVCTIIYIIPRTVVLGAILLTGYLGGAIAIMYAAKQPFPFPVVFAVLVWAGPALRIGKLRGFFLL